MIIAHEELCELMEQKRKSRIQIQIHEKMNDIRNIISLMGKKDDLSNTYFVKDNIVAKKKCCWINTSYCNKDLNIQ